MSDTTVATAEGTAIAVDSANSNAQAPAPAPKPAPASPEEPSWLPSRLERERAKVLKDLGIESFEDAKKAVDKAKAAEESQKSDAQKRGELETTLKSERAEKQALADALGAYAKSQMAALTEEQRTAISDLAGDDPAKQLKAIEKLAPTWVKSAPQSASAATATEPKDTAPPPAAPKDGNTSNPSDAKAIYEEMVKTNPIIAARFAIANGVFDETK